jgi:hypothetical protein
MDANEDIRAFGNTIAPSGLHEVLLERHGPNAPATYHGGSQPIDGVFASPSIHIVQGGYLEFGYGPHTDHRGLWIDVHYQIAFGHIMPPIPSHQARRLKTSDPHIVKRYTDICEIGHINFNKPAHTPFPHISRSKWNTSMPYAKPACA